MEGVRFYSEAFGFTKIAEPIAGLAVLQAGNSELCILEKAADTAPAQGSSDRRYYQRHWTPVHLDLHVDDFESSLARALAAGAKQERLFASSDKHPAVAFCSDPFGHGFCLIERRRK
jgi:uncharacterized glyoxalase superfamily protein PhnB